MTVDATPSSPVGSVSIGISTDVTPDGDRVVILNAEQVNLIAAKRTKKNPQKWVVKKHGSQVGELNQLKLKTVILHNDRDGEIHMTQPVGFITADLVSVDN